MSTENLRSTSGDLNPAPAPRPDTATMTDRQLANAVLTRLIRPRTGEIRRLADAVVASAGKKQRKKKDGKGRKLAKIPGQAGKKKKKD